MWQTLESLGYAKNIPLNINLNFSDWFNDFYKQSITVFNKREDFLCTEFYNKVRGGGSITIIV